MTMTQMRRSRVGRNNTRWYYDGVANEFRVKLHSTTVFAFNPLTDTVRLNSGGWRTVTTKRRMNQAADEFNLPYRVFQKDFEWFVDIMGETVEFYDNMEFKVPDQVTRYGLTKGE